jgi:hypothetical protein
MQVYFSLDKMSQLMYALGMNTKTLALVALFATTQVFAGEFTYRPGVGLGNGHFFDGLQTKFALSYLDTMNKTFLYKVEGGVFTDSNRGSKSAGYINPSIGLEVRPGWFYAQTFLGVALISATDNKLSTNYEFTHDLSLGIKDDSGKGFGVGVMHMSNAGIKKPNIGRNWFFVEIKVPLK